MLSAGPSGERLVNLSLCATGRISRHMLRGAFWYAASKRLHATAQIRQCSWWLAPDRTGARCAGPLPGISEGDIQQGMDATPDASLRRERWKLTARVVRALERPMLLLSAISPVNDFPSQHASRCEPVNVCVCRRVSRTPYTVSTQFRSSLREPQRQGAPCTHTDAFMIGDGDRPQPAKDLSSSRRTERGRPGWSADRSRPARAQKRGRARATRAGSSYAPPS